MASLMKRVRDDSADSELDSSDCKRLREDLLGLLDDSDPSDESAHGLDSFMKSFQDEISAPAAVIDLTSDSGDSQPDLGYLLEASDDELGLPPSGGSGEEEAKEEADLVLRVDSDSLGIGGFWGFEDSVLSYGPYGLGTGEGFESGNEFVNIDGLFGYVDTYVDSSDYSDLSWRSETLPGL